MDANKNSMEHTRIINKIQYGNRKILDRLGLTFKDDDRDPFQEGEDAEDGEL